MSNLFRNWTFVRWLRLSFGILLAIEAIKLNDWLAGAFSILFFYQAYTNSGFCLGRSCSVPHNTTTNSNEIGFEEIKLESHKSEKLN
ncbi:MAG: hypothetical protein JSU07_04140 [Bacteroidetes bacterium]|nr:hypothetical protein [Bacteroidota bacterium]